MCTWFFGVKADRANGVASIEAVESSPEPAEPSATEFAEPFKLPSEEESHHKLEDLSGDWISGDGEQKAKLDGQILTFGETPDWPDLQGRDFLLGENLQFLSETGHYWMSWEADSIAFTKEDRTTKSLSGLTLYRKGSPFAEARPPLPRTPPPPSIQALLDLVPTIREGETLKAVLVRSPLGWDGKMPVIGGHSGFGESDMVFDLGVNGEWVLKAKEVEGGKILRFQVVRGYVKDRNGKGPDVQRVVFPYFEFGKIITGPMESRPARE